MKVTASTSTLALVLLAASAVGASGANADVVELTFVGEEPLLKFMAAAEADGQKTHYGDPSGGCMEDEHPFQIQGVDGMICAPKCTAFRPCPTDVPDGVTARPQCALKSPDGNTYCALICNPGGGGDGSNARLRASVGDGECGEATCNAIGGAGICTWSQ